MEVRIQENLVYLCHHISNLTEILLHLIQQRIISKDECDQITRLHLTPTEKNKHLLDVVQKKDWNKVGNVFLEILRKTHNEHCADIIEGKSIQPKPTNNLPHLKISKWWPDKKLLLKSLYKRKIGGRLLVEELHERILEDDRRMVVLCESANAAKLTGMGGVGKTVTATWYAHNYEKEYDHILWIDCGEDSLLKSFRTLARDLKIEDRNELQAVGEFARKCFETLSGFKCLWVYDNAENYQGKDGIIDVLPKCQDNFYCLITSRSRQWGFESGYGQISLFELEIFGDDESLEFLKANLKQEIKYAEYQLKELSLLLGNLPLALQLAVATLNSGKIDLKNFIEKTSTQDVENIVDVKFDAYEKTIYKSVKMSLDLVAKEKGGKEALKILKIFAYIRPDQAPSKFLLTILNLSLKVLQKSIDLLEKYSLINKTGKILDIPYEVGFLGRFFGWGKTKVEMDILSIHRLLQQVIRHNGREEERKTIKKILSCKGFIEYKLIPFTKYADEDLRKMFPEVKAQLLDQQQLNSLMREKRLDESVEFAKFIHQELKTNTTKFNYAICLYQDEKLEECVETLEELKQNKMIEEIKYGGDDVETGLFKLGIEISRVLVGGHLLLAYTKIDDKEKINKILRKRNEFRTISSPEYLGSLIRLFQSDLHSNFCLMNKYSFIDLKLDVGTKKIELFGCSLSLNSFDRLSAQDLTLEYVSFFRDGQELEEVTANEFLDLQKIKRQALICHNKKKNMILDLRGDISMEYLYLRNMRLLNSNLSNWKVKELQFWTIPLEEKMSIKALEIAILYSSLDVSCLTPTVQKLSLCAVKVFASGSGAVELPDLKYLKLEEMEDVDCLAHFHSVPLTHVHFGEIRQELNVDLLPQSLSHLQLTANTNIVGAVKKLDTLILQGFLFEKVLECLTHFQTDNLVIHNSSIQPKELLQLMNQQINTIAVGTIIWTKGDFRTYTGKFDKKGEYYLLTGGRGRSMEKMEFVKLVKLF